MFCDKCGAEVPKENKFCTKCGAEIVKTKSTKKETSEVEEYKLKDKEIEKLSEAFASKNEKYIASLGNGYILNYLTKGSINRGFAFISDKRVYFKGSCLSGTGKNLVKTNEERVVDIKNITGSGFVFQNYWGIVISLVITLLISIVALICIFAFGDFREFNSRAAFVDSTILMGVSYKTDKIIYICISFLPIMIGCIIGIAKFLLKRKTLFRIEYAGGCIAFDVSFYAKAEIDDFQKQLRRVKDLAEEAAMGKVVVETTAQTVTQNNMSDELRKYADLLKDGLISQEEYESMKKKLLGL